MLRSTVYWHDRENVRCAAPLDSDKQYDVCIVGAGYTGLWTAHFLQQSSPALNIAILEARYAGAGASGHNDGFVLQALGGHGARSLWVRYGHDEMLRTFRALRNSAVEIGRFCVAADLDVEFEASPIYSVATVESHRRKLSASLQLATRLDLRADEPLDSQALSDLFGSATVLAGYRVGGGLLNPFKLARGLAQVVVSNGAHLYEATPVTEIAESKSGVSAITETGRVLCDKVVLATDAFQSWFPPLASQSSCFRSYILVSEQLNRAQLERLNWVHRPGFVDCHIPALFGRLTWDNRILLGGGLTVRARSTEHGSLRREQERAERRLSMLFRYLFPASRDVRPEYVYSGIIGVSKDMVPHVGPLSSRVSYAYGYSGHGIVATHLAAQALRDLTLETQNDAARLPFALSVPSSAALRIPSLKGWTATARRSVADWTSDRAVRAELRRVDREETFRSST